MQTSSVASWSTHRTIASWARARLVEANVAIAHFRQGALPVSFDCPECDHTNVYRVADATHGPDPRVECERCGEEYRLVSEARGRIRASRVILGMEG